MNKSVIQNVLLWKGGARLYSKYPGAIFEPVECTWLTAPAAPDRPIRIVDVNPYSHATVLSAEQKLTRAGYRVAEIVTVPYQAPSPAPAPLIVIAGLPCTGKSAIAHQIAVQNGGIRLKWARFVDNAGLYGEKAAELEAIDPLVFARRAYETIRRRVEGNIPVVLDGVKDIRAVQFIGYAAERPIVPLFFETDERIRQACLKMRQDADDRHDETRQALFAERLARMRAHSVVVDLTSADHHTARALLERNGIAIRLPVGNTIISKFFLLDLIDYVAQKPEAGSAPLLRPFHVRYSERYALEGNTAYVVNLVASAFRVIDDIIDNDTHRRIVCGNTERVIPALWTEVGIWPAAYQALEAVAYAAAHVPDRRAFLEMVQRVTAAVRIELAADEEGRRLTPEEYVATLQRETAFRAWIASLTGQSADEMVRDAIRAQIKNDAYAGPKSLESMRLPEMFEQISESLVKFSREEETDGS